MKFRMIAPLLAAALLVSGIATAQSKPEAEKKDPLPLVRIASNVARNIQDRNLNGFLVIYIDSQSWASGLKDGDLGPFLKLKEAKSGRSAVLFFSPEKDIAIGVFFDGDSAFGAASVKAKNGKIDANDISAAYKPISKEMLKDAGQDLQFDKGDVSTDDGQPVTAFQISAAKKPAD
ncbi:MAG: hypothetical protein ACXV7C_00870 [Candidatus Angelobacter sp.]